jgi:hypothetical protein
MGYLQDKDCSVIQLRTLMDFSGTADCSCGWNAWGSVWFNVNLLNAQTIRFSDAVAMSSSIIPPSKNCAWTPQNLISQMQTCLLWKRGESEICPPPPIVKWYLCWFYKLLAAQKIISGLYYRFRPRNVYDVEVEKCRNIFHSFVRI